MSQPNRFVKGTVLASSITLVAALVVYRADAFHWQTVAEPAAASSDVSPTTAAETLAISAEPPSSSYVDFDPFDTPRSPFDKVAAAQPTVAVSASGSDGALMDSSKSGRMFLAPATTGSGSGSTIMYSSKDGIVFPPNSPTAPAP